MLGLLKTVNSCSIPEEKLEERRLVTAFDRCWPEFDSQFQGLLKNRPEPVGEKEEPRLYAGNPFDVAGTQPGASKYFRSQTSRKRSPVRPNRPGLVAFGAGISGVIDGVTGPEGPFYWGIRLERVKGIEPS